MQFLNSSIQSNSLFLFAINTDRRTEKASKHQNIKYVSENIFSLIASARATHMITFNRLRVGDQLVQSAGSGTLIYSVF